ncbi:MAG: S9 family peptidase, partial [Phormidesmis sp.]
MTLPAQDTWQTPPEPIASMLKAKQLPAVGFSPNNEWIVECGQTELPPLYELSAPQVAIAGFQVNPRVWEPAKAGYFISLAIRRRDETIARPVKLPENPRIRNLSWSRDSRYISFTQTTTDVDDQRKNGVSLWVLEMETGEVRSLTGPILNSTFGNPNRWLPDNTLICKVRADDSSPPEAPTLPIGPIIEESLGRVAPAQTYTNLLQNRHDEALLEYYLTSKLVRISLDGSQTPVMGPDLFKSIAPSPDGQWLKITTAHRPFSYQVTISRFPVRVEVFDVWGKPAYTVTDLPLAEEIPINFDSVREGIRSTGWRADKPATLYMVEALDGGDADKESEYRDCISTLEAPFTSEPKTLWKTTLRFNAILWGNGDTAIAYEAMY